MIDAEIWLNAEVIGTLSNGLNHSVVLMSEHKDYSDICTQALKIYQIFIGRREAEQIQHYNKIIHNQLDSTFDKAIRPTTIDLLCDIIQRFTSKTKKNYMKIISGCIDSCTNSIYKARLTIELEIKS